MKTLRSALLLFGALFVVCLLVPSVSFAQEDPLPPCCHDIVIIIPPLGDGTDVIIIDDDSVVPPDPGQPEPSAQLIPSGISIPAAQMAADRPRSIADAQNPFLRIWNL
jgi:hypothetical protein